MFERHPSQSLRPMRRRHRPRPLVGRAAKAPERKGGGVRLALLALIAEGLRQGCLRLARPANGQGVEVHAADPRRPVLLPSSAHYPGFPAAGPRR